MSARSAPDESNGRAGVTPRSAVPFLPAKHSLATLRRAAADCQGCPLYLRATQTVFGSGAAKAAFMFVGEQPGDVEDQLGKPFVGPAGKLLDEALAEANIRSAEVYVTNAVKHFKWTPRGKRRLHAKPSAREVAACRPWLEAEVAAVGPRLIVCLGATAVQSVIGRTFRLTRQHGEVVESLLGRQTLATYHPAAVLRAPDATRHQMRQALIDDLRTAAQFVRQRQKA